MPSVRECSVLLLFLFMIPFPVFVNAQNGHSLSWGVAEHDIFRFEIEKNSVALGAIKIQINETLPLIPNNISDWDSLPFPSLSVAWVNGTKWGEYHSIRSFIKSPILPIGDWTLLTKLLEMRDHEIYGLDIDNTDTVTWTYSFRQNITGRQDFYYCSSLYSKDDGVMQSLRLEVFNITLDRVTEVLIAHQYNPTLSPPSSVIYSSFVIILGAALAFVALYIRRNVN